VTIWEGSTSSPRAEVAVIRMPERGSHVEIWHAGALVLIIVAAGYESQAAKAHREQQAIQPTPAKPTTTVSSVISSRQPGSKPEWLLIVPPEEPRPFGQTRAVTEAPLSHPDVPPRTRISSLVALELHQRGCSASPATIRASSHEPSPRCRARACGLVSDGAAVWI
jgi:hypothetical protein